MKFLKRNAKLLEMIEHGEIFKVCTEGVPDKKGPLFNWRVFEWYILVFGVSLMLLL